MSGESGEQQGILNRVDLGRLDAEQEQEERMREFFVDVGSVNEVRSGKFLVVGRKGSGKTSIFRHLAASIDGRVVQMDLDKYVFQAHHLLVDNGVSRDLAFTESWRAAIIVAMFSSLSQSIGWLRRLRGRLILRRLGAGPNGNPLLAIIGWLARIENVKLPSVNGLVDLGQIKLKSSSEGAIQPSTSRLIDSLLQILNPFIEGGDVTVLIDRLDDAWDGSEESLRLIAGAVRAARDFAIASHRSPSMGFPPVVVFLRSDLWAKCEFNDKNKMPADTVELAWGDEDLARVVDLRVSRSAEIPEGTTWTTLFDSEKMRQGVSPLNYMLKRSLGRPRDMVAFTQFAVDIAKKKKHTVVQKDDIYEAEEQYSRHVLEELRDEIRRHVGDFDAIVNALRSLKVRTFRIEEWQSAALRFGIDLPDSVQVLKLLFESGSVGVRQSGGSRGGSTIVYHYQRALMQVDEPGAILQIHPALTKELALREQYSSSTQGRRAM